MAAREIDIRWASEPDDVPGAIAVRRQVFCHEQGVPFEEEPVGLDDQAEHLVALVSDGDDGERVIGTLRLLVSAGSAKIGRVAVEREWRRRGIAARMLRLALLRARERGCRRARLAAQLEAVALYEHAGFAVESDEFEEAGIPHVWMGMAIAPS